MFKESKPGVVNREEAAVGARPLPAAALKPWGVGAAGAVRAGCGGQRSPRGACLKPLYVFRLG